MKRVGQLKNDLDPKKKEIYNPKLEQVILCGNPKDSKNPIRFIPVDVDVEED